MAPARPLVLFLPLRLAMSTHVCSAPAIGPTFVVVIEGVDGDEMFVSGDHMNIDPASGQIRWQGDVKLRVRSISIEAQQMTINPQGGPRAPVVLELQQPPRGTLKARATHVSGSGTSQQIFTGKAELVAPAWTVRS